MNGTAGVGQLSCHQHTDWEPLALRPGTKIVLLNQGYVVYQGRGSPDVAPLAAVWGQGHMAATPCQGDTSTQD